MKVLFQIEFIPKEIDSASANFWRVASSGSAGAVDVQEKRKKVRKSGANKSFIH
jgi:hypothetical protein